MQVVIVATVAVLLIIFCIILDKKVHTYAIGGTAYSCVFIEGVA